MENKFIYVPVSVQEAPKDIELKFITKYGEIYTGTFDGEDFLKADSICPKRIVDYCLIPVKLPSEDEIPETASTFVRLFDGCSKSFIVGYNYLLSIINQKK